MYCGLWELVVYDDEVGGVVDDAGGLVGSWFGKVCTKAHPVFEGVAAFGARRGG